MNTNLESLTFCFNKDSNKAYPMLYEKKIMNEFDIKFNIMFSIMVMDKEKIPGNKEKLSRNNVNATPTF